MKATIKVFNSERKKFAVASTVTQVKVKDQKKLPEFAMIEVDVRNPADLYELGKLISSVSGDEFSTEEKTAEQAAPAAAVAQAKKK